MLFSKVVQGFLLAARGGLYSPSYIPTIEHELNYMCKYFGDPELNSLTPEHWQRYLLHLRTEYQPKRFSGDQSPLSEATIDNHWKTIRGFYNWAVDNQLLSTNRPDLKLPRPKHSSPQVVPFTEDEVKRLLHACEFTTVVKQSGRTYKIKRQHADRDKAILMILLDTGMRLGEFYRLKVGDVNLENGEVYIRPVRDGRKSKGRTVFLGSRTKQIVWKYIAQRQARSDLSLPLFDLKASSIRLQINRIGHNAKVTHAYPHKFRHTFAVFYLRNGGDVFTLQRLLGHATLAMTLRYVNIVKDDLANAHKTASPVDNWRL